MVKLRIDDKKIEAEPGLSILEVCKKNDIVIPTLCYHAHLSKAGNCRMCLVEIENNPKLVTSCTQPVQDGLIIHTNSPKVRAARASNLEFLLANHPLDCPVCDKGGECTLQDLSFTYGDCSSRFDFDKRITSNKHLGPLITTEMTRCIHCTRCIRFLNEVAGTCELGGLGRGEKLEITTYLETGLTSELSGNLVDICPVGALNSKSFASRARPWELTSTPSIDVLDAVGSHIRIDCHDQKIVRIVPRVCDAINTAWISNKTRYAFDGLTYQRLEKPYVRKEGVLCEATWDEAFRTIKQKLAPLSGTEIAAISGDLTDCETMVCLKDLFDSLNSPHLDCRQDGSILDRQARWSYLFNTTLAGIDRTDACLLIATNPRHEAVLVNARLSKRSGLNVGLIGPAVDLRYKYTHLGETTAVLKDIALQKHPFAHVLAHASKPMLILGQGALNRRDSHAIFQLAQKIALHAGMLRPDWNGFNVLHTSAARVGGLELGFTTSTVSDILDKTQRGQIKAAYLIGADEIPMEKLGEAFVIYQGHHGEKGAQRADVILPGAAYTEKNATYVNTEGRPQHTQQAIPPPGLAKEDWRIIRKLSEILGHPLPYNTLEDVRQRLIEVSPLFGKIGEIMPTPWEEIKNPSQESLSQVPFSYAPFTDVISRHSPTLAVP